MVYSQWIGAALSVVFCAATLAQPALVRESARQIPVAYEVDVVIVGGSTGAVSAAVAAAQGGAKVFLAAPRPYLGEDMTATMRLWLEEGESPLTDLAKRIYTDKAETADHSIVNALPIKYTASLPSSPKHKDKNPPSILADGVIGRADNHSVQYDGDVTITTELASAQIVKEARIAFFHRSGGDFNPRSVAVETSVDGKTWTREADLDCTAPRDDLILVSAPIGKSIRHARFIVKKADDATRVLLGEISLISDAPAPKPTEMAVKPIRPMHVKKTLDEALLAAKVPYLFGCYATDVLKDVDGRPCGIVMVNRAGRQAVLAKTIIDATDRAAVARMAGAQFSAYPAGPQRFGRIIVGGPVTTAANLTAKQTGLSFGQPIEGGRGYAGATDIIDYSMRIPMADGSFASFAKAEQIARDLTEADGVQANTEVIFQTPPDAMKGRKQVAGPFSAQLDLDAFRPAGVDRIYVLNGLADISRELAAKVIRPVNLMAIGERIGAAAAAEAKGVAAIRQARLFAPAAPTGFADVRESLSSIRPTQKSMLAIDSPERGLEVLGVYDVVVVGGGTGGAPAGIAAARNGAKTLVLEYLHGMGGVGTMGLISSYYWGYRGGFTKTVLDGAASWNPLKKSEWWRAANREAGADVWYGVLGCGSYVEGGQVKGVIVATPHGRGVVLAKVVIDSTGNADIASTAGAQTEHTSANELAQQGTGLPRWSLGTGYFNTDFTIVDETDMLDIWHVLVYAKNKYANAFDLGQLIDTRERRRIVGEHTITLPDCVNNRTYPDTICIAYSNFDTHGYTVDPYLLIEHPEKRGITVNIPYRCLLPTGVDGLLCTGLDISVHRDALPLVRMQPDTQNRGFAAGLIAAKSIKAGVSLRNVDLPAVQKELAALGIIPETALGAKDSYPLADEAIAQAVADARTGKGMAVIVTNQDRSLPLLRKAYAAETDPAAKRTYARILGVLGDKTGIDTLVAALDEEQWDKGWNYTGMGQFGSSLSWVDLLLTATARTRDIKALDPILRKTAQLDATAAFSHHRAVAMALELFPGPRSAEALHALLSKPGMQGYVHASVEDARRLSGNNPNDNNTRATSLRELFLARALYRCGDKDGLGRKIIEQYAHDLRGHLARHAAAVLEEKR